MPGSSSEDNPAFTIKTGFGQHNAISQDQRQGRNRADSGQSPARPLHVMPHERRGQMDAPAASVDEVDVSLYQLGGFSLIQNGQ